MDAVETAGATEQLSREHAHDDGREARLLRRIEREAHRFDIIALLRLLRHLGFGPDDIRFRSLPTRSVQSNMITEVEFFSEPSRMVFITLNMGLTGYQSPIPSYFMKEVESGTIDEDAFLAFLQFFDDHLVRSFLNAVYPERDERLYPQWDQTRSWYLRCLALKSSSTLQWLFQLVFPELEVAVGRGRHQRPLMGSDVRLGRSRLGDASVFGGRARAGDNGFEITLLSEEEYSYNHKNWGAEARRRLEELVLPLLIETDLSLRVILVIRRKRGWARLGAGSLLGYDPLKGGGTQARRVAIFNGQVAQANGSDRRA